MRVDVELRDKQSVLILAVGLVMLAVGIYCTWSGI